MDQPGLTSEALLLPTPAMPGCTSSATSRNSSVISRKPSRLRPWLGFPYLRCVPSSSSCSLGECCPTSPSHSPVSSCSSASHTNLWLVRGGDLHHVRRALHGRDLLIVPHVRRPLLLECQVLREAMGALYLMDDRLVLLFSSSASFVELFYLSLISCSVPTVNEKEQ
ncbi:hypothetical protein BHM03_00001501 [Ensete ventricosum]|nr:hypothetical protein BHM03_00001501 [Ensete ventricosum]